MKKKDLKKIKKLIKKAHSKFETEAAIIAMTHGMHLLASTSRSTEKEEEYEDDGGDINIDCTGSQVLKGVGDGDNIEIDFWGGAGPAKVRSNAAKYAKDEAKSEALDDLKDQIKRVVCAEGCVRKVVGKPVVTYGRVRIQRVNTGYFVGYRASVSATAKQTVECVKKAEGEGGEE